MELTVFHAGMSQSTRAEVTGLDEISLLLPVMTAALSVFSPLMVTKVDPDEVSSTSNSMLALSMTAPRGTCKLLNRMPAIWGFDPSAPSSKSLLVRLTLPLEILSSASSEEALTCEVTVTSTTVGVAVDVRVNDGVKEAVGVIDGVGVAEAVGVAVDVGVIEGVGVVEAVGVAVNVGVNDGVKEAVGVIEGVGVVEAVGVAVDVRVNDGVKEAVGVIEGVGVVEAVGVAVDVGVIEGVGEAEGVNDGVSVGVGTGAVEYVTTSLGAPVVEPLYASAVRCPLPVTTIAIELPCDQPKRLTIS